MYLSSKGNTSEEKLLRHNAFLPIIMDKSHFCKKQDRIEERSGLK